MAEKWLGLDIKPIRGRLCAHAASDWRQLDAGFIPDDEGTVLFKYRGQTTSGPTLVASLIERLWE